MSFFPQFEMAGELPPQATRLGPKLRALAAEGICIGTSSWKYEGWVGSIYRPERYKVRGKFSNKKFESECLSEFAETFPIVCGDFAFYQFPSSEYWKRLFQESPESLQFAFKVPEDITAAKWPRHARYGTRAGQDNVHFLDAKVFQTLFARPLERYASRVATLIFEFGTFAKSTFPTPDLFLSRLDPFLAALPGGFRYSIEIRNPEYLGSNYFTLLASHGVAHVFNAWTRMPEIAAQMEMPGAFTADHIVARCLLRKGRTFEQGVEAFAPYQHIQDPNPSVRDAIRRLAEHARQRKKPAFLFVNNRLEGNAPSTIEAIVDSLDASP